MFIYVEGEIITFRVHMSLVEKHGRCTRREALLREEEGSGLGEGWAWG